MPVATRQRPETAPLNAIVEAEQAVIGAILRDPAALARVADLLRPDDFSERLHRGVFERAQELVEAGQPVTIEAVLPRVASVGLGGELAGPYLARLQARPPVDPRAPARVLAEAARRRTAEASDGTGYDEDFYSWANEQAERLRRGEWSRLDALNLAEEIEDSGREVFNALQSAFRIILLHLLKWDRQPEKRSRSWITSIKAQRLEVEWILENNSGIRRRVPEAVAKAYRRARIEAAGETGLAERAFPIDCPYDLGEILGRDIPWPPVEAPRRRKRPSNG
jgi:hypothetical protein